MALGLIELLIIGLIAAGMVLLAVTMVWPRGDERIVREWAAAHALPLTPGNVGFVRHYLTSGRRLRTICVIGGLVLPPLVRLAIDPYAGPTRFTISFMAILGGYLVGTLWAELTLTRPRAGQARAASLAPRVITEYLPPVLRWAPRVVAALTVASWAAAVVTRDWPANRAGTSSAGVELVLHPLTTSSAVLWSVLAVLTAVAIEVVQRWIVRRPQPIVAPDLLAADDAVRSQSVHLLGGTGVAIMLCWLIAPLFFLTVTVGGPLATGFGLCGIACVLVAIFFWRYYGNRAWRVPRRYAMSDATAVSP